MDRTSVVSIGSIHAQCCLFTYVTRVTQIVYTVDKVGFTRFIVSFVVFSFQSELAI